jgi:hypothetical protein
VGCIKGNNRWGKEMKHFKCGLCKENKREWMNRYDLRKHLRDEHRIKKNLTNRHHEERNNLEKQRWWIEEEF